MAQIIDLRYPHRNGQPTGSRPLLVIPGETRADYCARAEGTVFQDSFPTPDARDADGRPLPCRYEIGSTDLDEDDNPWTEICVPGGGRVIALVMPELAEKVVAAMTDAGVSLLG